MSSKRRTATVRSARVVARSTHRRGVMAAADIKQVQSLLNAKTTDGLTLALSLLESLGAKRSDYEAVFTDRVVSSIVRDKQVSADTVRRWEQLLVAIVGLPAIVARFSHHAAKAVMQRKGFLDLDTLSRLSVESAHALAVRKEGGRAVYALNLTGLKSLDADVAKALAGFRGALWLDGLESLASDVVRSLATHKGDSISLNGLSMLSDEAAKALASHGGDSLSLDGLQSLCPAVARALARYRGRLLSLEGVKAISDEAAEMLRMRHEGWLCMNGLTSLSSAAAHVFAQSKRFLKLGGVTTLTLKASQALARHKGIVELGVTELQAEVAAALSQFQGRVLNLRELAVVPLQAALLQANRNISLPEKFRPEEAVRTKRSMGNRGRTMARASSLTDDDARALLGRVGILEIPAVTALSDSVAEILGGHKGGSLVLPGVSSLSDAAAESLSRHKGPLHLTGLTSLSDVAAECLGKRTGLLRLDGLVAMSDEAAIRLSNHSGYLSLRGLQSLGDRAANSLSTHKGFMNLGSVSHLSEAAAAALSRHSWGMNLQGVHQLSDSAAEHLCRLRFTTTNARGKEIRVTDAVAKQLKAARVRLRRRA